MRHIRRAPHRRAAACRWSLMGAHDGPISGPKCSACLWAVSSQLGAARLNCGFWRRGLAGSANCPREGAAGFEIAATTTRPQHASESRSLGHPEHGLECVRVVSQPECSSGLVWSCSGPVRSVAPRPVAPHSGVLLVSLTSTIDEINQIAPTQPVDIHHTFWRRWPRSRPLSACVDVVDVEIVAVVVAVRICYFVAVVVEAFLRVQSVASQRERERESDRSRTDGALVNLDD